MKYYPKIKFRASLKVDTGNCINFIKQKRSGPRKQFTVWFLPQDLRYILNKKFSEKQREKIIKAYMRQVFNNKEKRQAIIGGCKKATQDWQKVAKRYFGLMDKVFKKHSWPKGNYRGFASIFHMFPRYIEPKIFFFPYVHKLPKFSNRVISHEMMHFLFFDYLDKKYGLKQNSKIVGKSNDYIWQVSEVFNNVIESWEPYKRVFNFGVRPYAGLEKMFVQMKKDWAKKQDIDWLLYRWLKKR